MFRGFTSVSLSMAELKLCTQRSARLLLAGWYGADVRCLIPFLLRNIWNSSDLNCGPLSLTNWDGTPYLANKLCSFSMVFVEVVVSIFSISNHLEWASTTINWKHAAEERSGKISMDSLSGWWWPFPWIYRCGNRFSLHWLATWAGLRGFLNFLVDSWPPYVASR